MSETDVARMTDDDLVAFVREHVYAAAIFQRHSVHDDNCSAAHAEAERRGKPWLYQRGWNSAYESAGYEPSDEERAAALEPRAKNGAAS